MQEEKVYGLNHAVKGSCSEATMKTVLHTSLAVVKPCDKHCNTCMHNVLFIMRCDFDNINVTVQYINLKKRPKARPT